MNTKLIGALLAACFASFAMPVLAGGYDAASDARTGGVVKASHVGHHAQHDGANPAAVKSHGDVGGSGTGKSESGRRVPTDTIDPMYRGG
ncbi:hypothetical protein ACFQ3P_26450 [Paraburkholderia sabiae]|jgi:hypothetical protein|uniref:Uncharacterized protein n=1 Tax=Paraburkholderia sabiae TaxID=273251 RepID=A0ABU9QGE3_9BURK|nr:hypothetical protein [Paraburkholderia sabiae]WJZ77576.1 hypothetical protein QEN71_36615 [Paraburkholderia sabiae]CAD6555433.1 hypothetical protein LMG24235_05683 [Paraburkholderia sabiae]CAG9233474.1 conserved exported hypothetical protein [Paraburkholderia sabiae]